MSTPPTLQTKKGKKAESVTSMEFEQWIGQLWQKLHTRRYQRKLPAGVSYKLAFDNAGVHKGANLQQFGIQAGDILHTPPYSSDMQKVVEHAHANLYHGMQDWLLQPEQQNRGKLPIEDCKAKHDALFYNMTEAIQKDVLSLPATYDEIIQKQGGYISKGNR